MLGFGAGIYLWLALHRISMEQCFPATLANCVARLLAVKSWGLVHQLWIAM